MKHLKTRHRSQGVDPTIGPDRTRQDLLLAAAQNFMDVEVQEHPDDLDSAMQTCLSDSFFDLAKSFYCRMVTRMTY